MFDIKSRISKLGCLRRLLHLLPLLPALVLILSAGVIVRADEVHLRDGRILTAESVWEAGETVFYRQGSIIASVSKSDVVKITRRAPDEAPLKAAASGAKSRSEAALADSSGDKKGRKITRLILTDGTQIDADAIWEDAGRIGYRLGKMQTFIDRAEVKSVLRDLVKDESEMPAGGNLRYSTGHRGLDQLILYNSVKHDVDPMLIYFVMREESAFNHRAVSRVGARGLMQLMPGTARRLGVRNINDPVENVDAGTRYLRTLLEMFDGDVNLALAAYNAGEDAVLRYGRRIPPYRETRNYVWRINAAYRRSMANP